ncbi:circularly permuted type 2 ATP-grasp protein [Nitratireductor sp. XY-223]|uniref:circularly permuted type 2 ATP-grasp protein n=1 Tax=Nitratireductor sp. XY-223 TaxID=2561926 RepID=UPI0010AAE6D7|nr:circularly permuted type 2 ATP-grasp protein [Nitratireductor sp. XY-223]
MSLVRRVSDRWNEQLAKSGPGDVERLLGTQQQRRLLIRDRPLCTVAKPHFVSDSELQRHGHVVNVLSNALVHARNYVVANREREAAHLGRYYDWIGDLMHLEPGEADHGAITRLDGFRAGAGMHFIELNADCPGGAGHNDGLAEVFQALETFKAVSGDFDLRPLMLQPAMGKALMDAWRDWGGARPPVLGIIGWFESFGTTAEAVASDAEPLRDAGIAGIVADHPEALEFDGRRLRLGGTEIDLVYRLMLTRDVLVQRDTLKPLLEALRKNAVCMVNPFRAELMGHKALFALITDPDVDLGLSAAERETVRDHVPWGRPLREAATLDREGRRVDLIDHVLENRETLVLKPTHAAKGEGVELGWHHDASSWEAAVRAALDADCIVQERVPMRSVSYPAAEPGLPEREMFEDTDPLVARGTLAGYLTRVSEMEIVNVSKEGSVVPSFVVGG